MLYTAEDYKFIKTNLVPWFQTMEIVSLKKGSPAGWAISLVTLTSIIAQQVRYKKVMTKKSRIVIYFNPISQGIVILV